MILDKNDFIYKRKIYARKCIVLVEIIYAAYNRSIFY